jgi:sister-chromatid-cohesion protein PDS5
MNVDTSSLATVSKDLINKRILRHKNTTVTALATCCIADVLRLHAPDPPYDDAELQVRKDNVNQRADTNFYFVPLFV